MFKGHIVIGSDNVDLTVTRFAWPAGEEGQEIKGQEEGEKGQRQKEGGLSLSVTKFDPNFFLFIRTFRMVFIRRKSLRRINPSMATKRMTLVPMMTRTMVR